jgi:hypothetical protein
MKLHKAQSHDVYRFLAISEPIAHLDYAQMHNKIAVKITVRVEFYRKQ